MNVLFRQSFEYGRLLLQFQRCGRVFEEMSWQISPLSGLSCVYPVMPVNPGHVPVPNVDIAATVVLGMHVAITAG